VPDVRILVIDDDEASRRALQLILDSDGWLIEMAALPDDALAKLAGGGWNLVITNVSMSSLSGPLFALLKELAEAKGSLRVLFLVPAVAESRALAEDARDLVEVEYEVLPVVATAAAALAPGASLVYEELGDNIAAHIIQRVGHPERAFASADHTLRETFRVMRGGSHSMEGRAVVARYDEALDSFTVWDATQAPHAIRAILAYLFDLPEHRVRVIAPPDVGGGLGPKTSFYPEEALVCWLARRLSLIRRSPLPISSLTPPWRELFATSTIRARPGSWPRAWVTPWDLMAVFETQRASD